MTNQQALSPLSKSSLFRRSELVFNVGSIYFRDNLLNKHFNRLKCREVHDSLRSDNQIRRRRRRRSVNYVMYNAF